MTRILLIALFTLFVFVACSVAKPKPVLIESVADYKQRLVEKQITIIEGDNDRIKKDMVFRLRDEPEALRINALGNDNLFIFQLSYELQCEREYNVYAVHFEGFKMVFRVN
jgi:hypothetical protein